MMKKFIISIIVVIAIVITGFLVYNWLFSKNENNTTNYSSSYNTTKTAIDTQNIVQNNIPSTPVEIELYSYSTPLKDDRANRVNNIKITCSRINGTIVKAGKEFSFCDTVGKPSSEDGYKEADAFGEDGKVIQAIGGGNCQVSTTLYNAALGVDGLKITERHEHARDVTYVKDGKDATVAYDYLDLKFKNTNDYDVKLYASVNDKKVMVKIVKVE